MRKAPIYDLPSSGALAVAGAKAMSRLQQKGWQPQELLRLNADSSRTWEEAHAGSSQRTLI